MAKFFEGIKGLEKKAGGRVYYNGKYYGRVDAGRSVYLQGYKAVLNVVMDIRGIRNALERKNYLILTMRGRCTTA